MLAATRAPRSTGDDDSDDDDTCGGSGGFRPKGRGTAKPLLLTAVERGGSVHARRIESHRTDAIAPAWRAWVDPMAKLMTDALPAYRRIGQSHPSHLTANHSKRQAPPRDSLLPPGTRRTAVTARQQTTALALTRTTRRGTSALRVLDTRL